MKLQISIYAIGVYQLKNLKQFKKYISTSTV